MDNRLHALGNLTVLNQSGNATMSNKPLAEKQREYQLAKVHALKLNYDFMNAEKWGVDQIDLRTKALCEAALKFWKI
jgi:hypothetical protein